MDTIPEVLADEIIEAYVPPIAEEVAPLTEEAQKPVEKPKPKKVSRRMLPKGKFKHKKPIVKGVLKIVKPSNRKIYDVPLNLIVSNPGNPGIARDREVIPSLYAQGFRVFPTKDLPDNRCLWTMLNGKPNKRIDAALRDEAVLMIKNFEENIVEMSESIGHTALVNPVHFVIKNGKIGIESGMVRALATSYWAANRKEPCTIAGEIEENFDEQEMLARAAVENIHIIINQPIAIAQRFALMRKLGMTPEQIAEKVRRSVPTIYNYLNLAELPNDIQDQVAAGRMTMGGALDFYKDAKEAEKPVEEIVEAWRQEEEAGNAEYGLPVGTRSKKKAKSRPTMMKWKSAFLIYCDFAETQPLKSDLIKLDKKELIAFVMKGHSTAMGAMREILQLDEEELKSLMIKHRAEELDLSDEDLGLADGERVVMG